MVLSWNEEVDVDGGFVLPLDESEQQKLPTTLSSSVVIDHGGSSTR